MLVYMLFYAAPHADPAIKDVGQNMLGLDAPPSRTIAGRCVVRS
jgi:hypothetical protein